MGTCCLGILIWLQGGTVRLYHPLELRLRSATSWVGIAWAHSPDQWEIAEVFTSALRLHAKAEPFQRIADSLGIQLYSWVGPEGAGLAILLPRPYLIAGVHWLYALLEAAPQAIELHWKSASHQYQKRWTGFSLEKELSWRLRSPNSPISSPPIEAGMAYLAECLQKRQLHLLSGGEISFREKNQLLRLKPPFSSPSSPSTEAASHSPSFPEDTAEENLWAYPAYVALSITLPESRSEWVAFLEAFFHRWYQEAPPLRWEGRLWGRTYLLQARLDGKSYAFLRGLRHLQPRSDQEMQTWQAAYALKRQQMRAHPEAFLDFWMPAALQQDTLPLPDTLPTDLWRRGWDFQAKGIWLYNEWLALDTLSEVSQDTLPLPSAKSIFPPPDFLWLGKGPLPLSEWAAALRLYWENGRPSPCELIGYYRHRRKYNERLKALHTLRRRLIRQYQIPPEALRVILRPVPPDYSEKVLRLKCTGS